MGEFRRAHASHRNILFMMDVDDLAQVFDGEDAGKAMMSTSPR